MKQLSLLLSVVSLIAVAILFYLFFSEKHPEKNNVKQTSGTAAASQNFSIAYFEMDSLENNFDYIKELMTNISDKERKLVGDLTSLQKKFQNRAGELQQRAQTMTQSEGEAANREIMDMDQRLKERKNQIDQELFEYKNSLLQDARNKIENYLKDYNKQKGYSYIFSYEPGFIYYRDSIYNITPDLVRGLNDLYKPKK